MFFRHHGCFLGAIWHLETTPNTLLEFFCSNCWNFSVPILSLVRSPSRGLSCLRGLFCPCWQRGFLAYFRLSGLLQAFWLTPGFLAFFRPSSSFLVYLTSGFLAFWYALLLVSWPSGMPRFWPLGLLACLASGLRPPGMPRFWSLLGF